MRPVENAKCEHDHIVGEQALLLQGRCKKREQFKMSRFNVNTASSAKINAQAPFEPKGQILLALQKLGGPFTTLICNRDLIDHDRPREQCSNM